MGNTKVKISKHELRKTMRYRRMINNTPFDDLDFSEFKTFENISEDNIKAFKNTDFNNIDFIQLFLSKEFDV